MSRQRLGSYGEQLAADYLERAGWRILHRNYRVGRREIDLVARRGGVVAFIEVKARRGREFGDPLEAVTARKRREIELVASVWLERHGAEEDLYRFDAIAVRLDRIGASRIEHLEDAWGI